MPAVRIENLSVTYVDRKKNLTNALSDFSCEFLSNKINVIVGESGCGKTTLLRAICQQFDYDGEIYFDDKNVDRIPLKERNIAYVDQNIFLFSHMIVYDLLAYPLKQQKLKSDDIDYKVKEMANTLGLSKLLTRKPNQLSIGERQKVSLGKALIKDPKVCLLDEPFANLSEQDKDDIFAYFLKAVKEKQITVILVTHDYSEALRLADMIYVMEDSKITFKGTKEELNNNQDNELIQYLKMSKNHGKTSENHK